MSDCRRLSYATVNGAWWDLAEAVILQAVRDYRLALQNPKKNWYQIEEIESFFYSDWFQMLSDGLNPDELIRRIKQMPQNETGENTTNAQSANVAVWGGTAGEPREGRKNG